VDADHELTDRARAWIDGIRGQFQGVPPAPVEPAAPRRTFASKLL
jgi:hypothetical protein